MKKAVIFLFLIAIPAKFYPQSFENMSREIKGEVNRIISENNKKVKAIPNPYRKISITSYGKNLMEYSNVYENYCHYDNTYLVKNDTIAYLHAKGQTAKIFSGEVKPKTSYGDLYEIEYYFTGRNSGYKCEKRVLLYRGNNFEAKQKEFEELIYTVTEINDTDYKSVYKSYSEEVKNK